MTTVKNTTAVFFRLFMLESLLPCIAEKKYLQSNAVYAKYYPISDLNEFSFFQTTLELVSRIAQVLCSYFYIV